MFEIKDTQVEKILDTNPATYAKRCENELRNRNYYRALLEIDTAISYSNNNKEYIEEKARVITSLRSLGDNEKNYIARCFRKNGDINSAIFWYNESQGNADSLYELGNLNFNKDESLAISFYKKAFEKGHNDSGYKLINYYVNKENIGSLYKAKKYANKLETIHLIDAKDILDKIDKNIKSYSVMHRGMYKLYRRKFIILFIIIIGMVSFDIYSHRSGKEVGKLVEYNFYIDGSPVDDEKKVVVGEEYSLESKYRMKPFYSLKGNLDYKVEDTSIVEVVSNNLKVLKEGTTKLDILWNGEVVESINIKAEKPYEKVNITGELDNIKIAEVKDITLGFDSNTSNIFDSDKLKIYSSNEKIIKIIKGGIKDLSVVGVSEGKADIVVSYKGTEIRKNIEVSGKLYSISTNVSRVSGDTLKLKENENIDNSQDILALENEQLKLSYAIYKSGYKESYEEYSDMVVKSNNDNIIEVIKPSASKSEILINAKKPGVATITLNYKGIEESITLKVLEKTHNIDTYNSDDNGNKKILTNISVELGKEYDFKYEIEKNYNTNILNETIDVDVYAEDSSIASAKLDLNNKVIINPIKAGKTNIILKTKYEIKKIPIEVKEPIKKVSTKYKYTVKVGTNYSKFKNGQDGTLTLAIDEIESKKVDTYSDGSVKEEEYESRVITTEKYIGINSNNELYKDSWYTSIRESEYDIYLEKVGESTNRDLIDGSYYCKLNFHDGRNNAKKEIIQAFNKVGDRFEAVFEFDFIENY